MNCQPLTRADTVDVGHPAWNSHSSGKEVNSGVGEIEIWSFYAGALVLAISGVSLGIGLIKLWQRCEPLQARTADKIAHFDPEDDWMPISKRRRT